MPGSYLKVAVLMTCHNRKDKTLACLDHLFGHNDITEFNFEVYLTDDGSTDGTKDAVKKQYPQVNILYGDGSLYWTGGTRKAMKAAKKKRFDYYVWLNDDTMLFDDALRSLFESYREVTSTEKQGIIMGGSMKDPKSGALTYGGYEKATSWHPLRFELLEPKNHAQKCEVLNGNFVIFSHEVFEKVGNLHPKLVHTEGDFEYSLRAKEMGIDSWIAPGFYGECPRNSIQGTWEDKSLSLASRYKKLFSIKGKPLRENFIYVSKYGGILWPLIFFGVYIKPLFDAVGIPIFWTSDSGKKR